MVWVAVSSTVLLLTTSPGIEQKVASAGFCTQPLKRSGIHPLILSTNDKAKWDANGPMVSPLPPDA